MTTWDNELVGVEGRTLWDVLEARVALTPDACAVIDEHDRALSFAEFRRLALRLAAGLHERGVHEGGNVSWQLPTSIEALAVMAALARLGARQNPITAIQRERDVAYALTAAQAEMVIVPGTWNGLDYVTQVDGLDWSGRPRPEIVVVNREQLPLGDPAIVPPPPTDPAVPRWVYFSTGTTADPKGVLHSDRSVLTAGWGYVDRLGLSGRSVAAMPFSVAHIGGIDVLTTILIAGYPVVVMERFVPAESIDLMRRHGVTYLGGSVAFGQLLLAEQRRRGEHVLPSLQFLNGGSGPTPAAAHAEITAGLGRAYVPAYGMTEVPMITTGSPGDSEELQRFTDGAPIEGVQMRFTGVDGEQVPDGEEGEIQLRGPMVTAGYLDPALTEAAFTADGWFRTGDLGHRRPDGYVCLTGRLKDIIIRKGEKIAPREIEELLAEHPAIDRVAVIGLPDEVRGERICAVIEPAGAASDLSLGALVDYLRERGLSTYKLPEQLEFVDTMPTAGTLLKISKAVLRERFAPGRRDRPARAG